MNNIFKNKKGTIPLGDNHYLKTDSFNGVSLVHFYPAEKEKTTKVDGKIVKTGEKESYISEEQTWHNTVGQALSEYVRQVCSSSKDLDELIAKNNQVLEILEEFKTKFRNWN